ncbi:MAG TPA: acyltransferase family protein [Candidatus Methylacidiphilales bacterium]|nr:acyltransferase family protein [Candidatus Methylacidiphilales bacterium]
MLSPLKYRPDIDGLRALAVLAVVFFHADLGVTGGYAGVDVFFVISGYLISGLILKEIENGEFSLLNFWIRRIRRLLPAFVLLVFACVAVGWFLLLPFEFKELGQSILAQTVLAANFYYYSHTGYFDQPAETLPLLHTWSLAVEEQFYLLFPFFLLALKGFSRRRLILITAALCVLSLGLCVYCSYFYPSANFYLLPTRAWELLIGALPAIAGMQKPLPRWMAESASWAGLFAILFAVFHYDSETRFPGTAAILPCAGAAVLMWANSLSLTSAGKLLASPPLVFIGLVSYSFYLWHWPVFVFAKHMTPLRMPLLVVALVAVSFLLAVLSWRYVETPIRRCAVFKGRTQILAFAGVMAGIMILAGFAIQAWQGVPSRFSPQALAYANGTYDKGIHTEVELEDVLKGNFIELGSGDRSLPIKLFVWGDSHAMTTLSILNQLCKEHGVRAVAATHIAMNPLLNIESSETRVAYKNAVLKFIRDNHVPEVLLVARWDTHGYEAPKVHDCLIETLGALKEAGARVWVMREVPRPGVNVPSFLAFGVMLGSQDPEGPACPLISYHKDIAVQNRIFENIPPSDTTILDPTPFFVRPNGDLILAAGGKALYFDDNHLSVAGAMRLRPLFEPLFEDLSKNN